MKTYRIVLCGYGNVGRIFVKLLETKKLQLAEKYNINPQVSAIIEWDGASVAHSGSSLPLQSLTTLGDGVRISALGEYWHDGAKLNDILSQIEADVLIEASTLNIVDGEPGMTHITTGLERGLHIITVNKGPLVVDYQKLDQLAKRKSLSLLFSGAVGAALPCIELGQQVLIGCDIVRIDALLNLTSNYILTELEDPDKSYMQVLKECQRIGVAEADPHMDVDGWDSACKLTIIANSVLGIPTKLEHLRVTSTSSISAAERAKAAEHGAVIRQIAVAEKDGNNYKLEVGPQWIGVDHPLRHLSSHHLGIAYKTDTMDTMVVTTEILQGTLSTAAAILRDLINIARAS